MKRFLILSSIVSLTATIPVVANDDATEQDLKELQGVWRVRQVEVHVDVTKGDLFFSQDEFRKLRWRIKGNKLTWMLPDSKEKEEAIKLHARRTPRFIDLSNTVDFVTFGPDGKSADARPVKTENWTLYGIYELKANTLKVCLPIVPNGSNLRPIEITGKEGSGCVVWVLERVENKE